MARLVTTVARGCANHCQRNHSLSAAVSAMKDQKLRKTRRATICERSPSAELSGYRRDASVASRTGQRRQVRNSVAAARGWRICYGAAMDRTFVALGALFAGLAVAAGAFGAHGLRGR